SRAPRDRGRGLFLENVPRILVLSSELKSALAGGVGERLDTAVVLEAAAVKHDGSHASPYRSLRDEPPDFGSGRLVGAGLELAPEVLVEARGSRHRVALRVVDDLRIDVLGRAVHGQARPPFRAFPQRAAHAPFAPFRLCERDHGFRPYF